MLMRSGLKMRTLIVQSNFELGQIWAGHLERLGATVLQVTTGQEALDVIQEQEMDVVVLDLVLKKGSALSVADYINFNQPTANVVFVTDTTFFSDGSIFSHCSNARAFFETRTPPADLAEIVHHYGTNALRDRAALRSSELGSSG
jgi:CheY-like chemotaxis protein